MSTDRHDTPPRSSTRRRVIKGVVVGVGGLLGAGVLGVGGVLLHDRNLRFARGAVRVIPDHRVALPAAAPRMVIARGPDPARNVRAAVERLGGMSQFVGPADVVVIKPNIGWDRAAALGANTHPDVVSEVVRRVRGANPRRGNVSDCPVRRSRAALERSGILVAASAAGAEVIAPEDSRYHPVYVSRRLGTWDVLEPFVIATKVINVPVAKHHPLTGVTCGLKNWFGITGRLRMTLHADVQRSIAEFAALMRPTLTIVDASRVLMEHGPEGRSLDDVKPVRTVAAGTDPVALDAWATSLFPGPPPANLALAAQLGLGRLDWQALAPVELVTG
ncbi:MAG: DUF362 domain-containing protein [Deltaproteobacteria bacterium]|nr:DUF362 domain-containing protein [Deltaproteobacteria bacterium]